jgi:hypothetical protein
MNKTFKIPTLFALPVVIGVVGVMAFFNQYFSTPTRADASVAPQNIRVTNITDASFTVSWTTEKPTSTLLQIQTDNGKTLPFFDEKSQTGTDKYITHSVTVRNLSASSTYRATIVTTAKEAEKPERTIQTFSKIPLTSNQLGPAYGTVTFPDGTPAAGALVYLSLPNSQLLSTTVTPTGSFLIPLNLIRTQNGEDLLPISGSAIPVQITVVYGNSVSEIQTDTDNDAPVETIILGMNRDNSKAQANKSTTTRSLASAPTITKTAVLGSQTNISTTQILLTSPPNNAKITEAFPLIAGRGIPNAPVRITLGLQSPFVVGTTVQKDGSWMYSPTKPLPIGKQQVTITTVDSTNKPVALTHQFEILKSGTQVLGDATASATPVFQLTPTPYTTEVPSPAVDSTDTPTPDIPETATSFPTVTILAAGILLVILGISSFMIIR